MSNRTFTPETGSHGAMAIATLRVLVLGMLAAIPGTGWAQCASIPGCTLVWSDEFSGTAVDTTKWEFMLGNGSAYGIPGWGNNELQYYTNTNATVANGELTITAKQQSLGGLNYTSSRLRTKDKGDWTYGRIEMRAKLPSGQGYWPAFWMLTSVPNYGGWAASGEIDIMESKGQNPGLIYNTIHYGGPYPANVFSGTTTSLVGAAGNFHTYAIEWQAGEIRWYVDGLLTLTKNSWYSTAGPFPAPFDVNFHVLLNLAVGGSFVGSPNGSTVFPASFVIDYVRVYQSPSQPPQGQVIFANMDHGYPFDFGWFAFNGGVGGGGLATNSTDLPPTNGGSASLQSGWGSGGVPGYFGGFGRRNPVDISGMTHFSFWINPDPGQNYRLELNIQDDDNGDGNISNAADDEFQYNCEIGPSGPCAISGGGWQLVTVPISSFVADNSSVFGGNDILDTAPGGNGQLVNMVVAVVSNSGADATFRTDYWVFKNLTDTDGDGVLEYLDNCKLSANPTQLDADLDGYGNICDGDINNSGTVTTADFGLLRSVLGQPVGFSATAAAADMNGSGTVTTADFGLLRARLGTAPGPSALAP
jgi:beta-glucanase (GH16 family)